MPQTTELDQDERVTDPKTEGQGISWGWAVKPNGDIVVRNWYLLLKAAKNLCGVLIFVVTLLIILLILFKTEVLDPNTVTIQMSAIFALVFIGLFLPAGSISLWKIYHESKGILLTQEAITYPVRYGPYGSFPLFRRTIKMDQVMTASPKSIHEAPYEYFYNLYLSSDYFVARLFFDTKGGRGSLVRTSTKKVSENS
jgi:hypothetical protein